MEEQLGIDRTRWRLPVRGWLPALPLDAFAFHLGNVLLEMYLVGQAQGRPVNMKREGLPRTAVSALIGFAWAIPLVALALWALGPLGLPTWALFAVAGLIFGLLVPYGMLRTAVASDLRCVLEIGPTALEVSLDLPGLVGDRALATLSGVSPALAAGRRMAWEDLTRARIAPGPTLELCTEGATYEVALAVTDLAALRQLQGQLDNRRKGARGRAPEALRALQPS